MCKLFLLALLHSLSPSLLFAAVLGLWTSLTGFLSRIFSIFHFLPVPGLFCTVWLCLNFSVICICVFQHFNHYMTKTPWIICTVCSRSSVLTWSCSSSSWMSCQRRWSCWLHPLWTWIVGSHLWLSTRWGLSLSSRYTGSKHTVLPWKTLLCLFHKGQEQDYYAC